MELLKAPSLLLVSALLCSLPVHAQPAPLPSPSRGQLLYSTHCVTCHSTQMHWRNDRRAQDWDTLKIQVRRWQGNAGLEWGEADITEVARHLNDSIYHFPQTDGRVSLAPAGAAR
jgi:mono/diheme cytochrome c family protein